MRRVIRCLRVLYALEKGTRFVRTGMAMWLVLTICCRSAAAIRRAVS